MVNVIFEIAKKETASYYNSKSKPYPERITSASILLYTHKSDRKYLGAKWPCVGCPGIRAHWP